MVGKDQFEITSRKATFEQAGFIELTPSEPRDVQWFLRQTAELEDLFTLLFSQPCSALWLVLSFSEEGSESYYSCLRGGNELNDSEPPPMHEHLVRLARIPESVEALLNNFFSKPEALYPVINIVNSTLSQPGAFHQLDFVNLVQALEGFHRVYTTPKYLVKNDFNSRLDTVKSAIELAFPEDSMKEQRDSLNNAIKFGNEKTQKTRLGELIAELSPDLRKNIIGNDDESFTNTVISTRNYYVHLDHSSAKKVIDDNLIPFRKMQLQMLLICLLLKTFGVAESVLIEGIRNTQLFRMYRHKINL